ncbi:MAG TPA: tetratricopeptide repeat protein, partial [Terriglobales bacterium]|nr:tetratricopeptide repeat protein [Terriglobales bacterium]
EDNLRHAIEQDGKRADAFYDLGKALLELKQEPGAIEALRRSVALNPSDPSPHYQLARALRLTGDAAGANSEMQLFEQLRKQQPQTGGMASGVH